MARYRNLFGVEGSYTANPRHRKRRRNPDFDLGRWMKFDHVVDGFTIGVGYLLSEQVTSDLKWAYSVPKGGQIDPMKQVQDFVGHVGVGILGATILDFAKQRGAGEKFAMGAFASAVTKIVANLHVLPEHILSPGSIQISHGGNGGGMLGDLTPADVRSSTYIPPVYGL